MADIKISDMTTTTSPADTDVVPLVQSSTNKKMTMLTLSEYIHGRRFIGDAFIVTDFASLPAAASYTGKLAYVQTTTGSILTLSRKAKGFYRSDGTNWTPDDLPYREASTVYVDASGRTNFVGDDVQEALGELDNAVTNKASLVHTHTSASITDFTEAAQDSIGSMIDSTLVYTDSTPLLSRAALTGDVTASSGSNSTTIASQSVTYSKIQNVSANSVLANNTGASASVTEVSLSASQLLGRGSTGNLAPITLGTNLSMSGATLNATGGGSGGASQGLIYATAMSNFMV